MAVRRAGWRWGRRKGVECRRILGYVIHVDSFPKAVVEVDMRLMIGRG